MKKKPLLVVMGAIVKNESILLIKRDKPPFKDMWCLPGGKIEFGEHPDEALQRELREETSTVIRKYKPIAVLSELVLNSELELVDHFIIFFYIVTDFSFERQMTQCKWFKIADLDEGLMPPSDYRLIRRYLCENKIAGHLQIYKSIIVEKNNEYEMIKFT